MYLNFNTIYKLQLTGHCGGDSGGAICVKKAEVGHMMICVITYHQCDSPYGYVDIHIIYVDLHLHM